MVTAVLLAATVTAVSQPMMRTPAERAKQLQERLSLSEEQTQKIVKIFTEAQKAREEKMGELMGDRDAMRTFMTEQTAKTDKSIEAILTKEQIQKYEELKKERRQRRRGL